MPAPKKPYLSKGEFFEQATDPALDADNRVGAKSKWMDTSVSPAILRERNAANTAWIRIDSIQGVVTIAISSAADNWSGTVTNTEILATQAVKLQVQNSNALGTAFVAELGTVANGSFNWKVYAFKKLYSGTFYLHWEVSP